MKTCSVCRGEGKVQDETEAAAAAAKTAEFAAARRKATLLEGLAKLWFYSSRGALVLSSGPLAIGMILGLHRLTALGGEFRPMAPGGEGTFFTMGIGLLALVVALIASLGAGDAAYWKRN